MKNNRLLCVAFVLSAVTWIALSVGCEMRPQETSGRPAGVDPSAKDKSATAVSPAASSNAAGSDTDGEHGHKDGGHGGIIVSLGRDSYHVEAVVAADGLIRLFTLGKDETRVIDVEAQGLKGFVKAEGDNDAQELVFEPQPQDGDSAGRTSMFVGKLPAALVGRSIDVTIPNIRIDGERFRLGFRTSQQSHSESGGMPDKVSSAAEKELYLIAGGHYTTADIEANGKVVASQKFKGIKSDHNMNPEPGDIVCPISGTKANPKFSWVIGGKTYQFCCPPCLDEFLTKAKTSTDPLPEPDSFIKK